VNDYKSFIIQTLNSYKCKSVYDEWKIVPISNKEEIIGFLKPVTFFYKKVYPEYIHHICKWRTENSSGFANVFENNINKTENWFDNVLLPREDRILFVIHTLKDIPIAHIGLSTFNFDNKSCEIDNVVRGAKDAPQGIMSCAISSLVTWSKEVLKVNNVYLRVLSDNLPGIHFYEKNNFVKQYDIPLYKHVSKDIIEWIHLDDAEDRRPDRYYTYMKLI